MLQFLFSPTKQFLFPSGKLLAAGRIYVYYKDTTDLAPLYDEDGDFHDNPIILDVNGRASVKADDNYEYRLEICSPDDELLYTCNAFYSGEGGGSGEFIVRHDWTLTGNGTSQSLLGVARYANLAVETPALTAYSGTVNDKKSLIIGLNSAYLASAIKDGTSAYTPLSSYLPFTSAVNSALDNKADWSAVEGFATKNYVDMELSFKQDKSDMQYYYQKYETSSREELEQAFANVQPATSFLTNMSAYTYSAAGPANAYTKHIIYLPTDRSGRRPRYVAGSFDWASTDGYISFFPARQFTNSAYMSYVSNNQCCNFGGGYDDSYWWHNQSFNFTASDNDTMYCIAIKDGSDSTVSCRNVQFTCFY